MCRSDHIGRSYVAEAWSQTASQADPYPSPPHHSDPRLDLDTLVSLETDSSGEEGIEETIVYLWSLRNSVAWDRVQEAVACHTIYTPVIKVRSGFLVLASPRILCTTGCFFLSVLFFCCFISLQWHLHPSPCNKMSWCISSSIPVICLEVDRFC